MREVPVVSTSEVISNETLEEQRAWVEDRLDASIAVSGVSEGWYWGGAGVPEVIWNGPQAEREGALASLLPLECGEHGAGRLDVSLRNKAAVGDPAAVADRVRTFWESEGWTATDVWSEPSPDEQYFRADREDGAELAFRASSSGMVLEVASTCSAHNTVTNWERYVDEPNAFDEEL